MATEMITLRVTPEQKAKLESLATQQGCSVSNVIRGWIDTDQLVVEVPPEYADEIAKCAELEEQSVPKFIREYLRNDHIIWRDINVYQYTGWKIVRLLRENGPMMIDELTSRFPDWAREELDNKVERLSAIGVIRQTLDGEYEMTEQ